MMRKSILWFWYIDGTGALISEMVLVKISVDGVCHVGKFVLRFIQRNII